MTGEGIKKKRDPIFTVCFVVFIVACAAVLGTFINDEYIKADDTKVAYGDTVVVNYTGTFYGYYGTENAVVFDTTNSDIGNDSNVAKSNSYSKSSYSTIDVTVGDGDYLAAFENCLIGHKVGDTIQVTIENAYTAPSETVYTDQSTTYNIAMVQTMSKTAFDDLYEDVDLTGGSVVYFTSAYGWNAMATYDTADNLVTITYLPTVGTTYEYVGNEDSEYGAVKFTVNSIGSDGNMSVTMTLEDTVTVSGTEIQMVELNVDGNTVYITGYSSNGTYSYKTCDETYNVTLYFTLEIVSIE
ncbi:MAG: FKBP-type peptidyl-prolyl cis-trans isomerase [Thermoplasmata archaeon]|nr:FKBP-type peptidyl-prolyl cis-trans isomerase [Thermoplasmata archaeon]